MDKFAKLAHLHLTGDDFIAAAKKLLRALHVPGPAITILLPVIANAVRLVVRDGTREAERAVFSPEANSAEATSATRTGFLANTFALPDGRWVTWGEATIADHAARIEYLEKLRGGIELTIGRHRDTIERLTGAGASCLNELETPQPKTPGKAGHRRHEAHSSTAGRSLSV